MVGVTLVEDDLHAGTYRRWRLTRIGRGRPHRCLADVRDGDLDTSLTLWIDVVDDGALMRATGNGGVGGLPHRMLRITTSEHDLHLSTD
jgi:hypothetical protein